MKLSVPTFVRGLRYWRLLVTLSVVLFVAGMGAVFATSTSFSSRAQPGANMKSGFVFIFRKGNRILSEEEQKRRTEEVRAWALQEGKAHDLEPRVLGDESLYLGDGDKNLKGEGTVIALNFIRATDLDEAVKIAKSHPGLRYGVSIEVRPWTDPRVQTVPK
jgi:hypothetical protein